MLVFLGHSVVTKGSRAGQSYRSEAHKVLVGLLRQKRKAKHLSLEVAAARMPAWMHFDFSRLARVERGERDLTYQELREIAKVVGSTITEVVCEVETILSTKLRVDRPHKKR